MGIRNLWGQWKSFARAMGEFQSRILLGVVYFFVVAPFGIITRIFKDPLLLKRKGSGSNWSPGDHPTSENLDKARKQF